MIATIIILYHRRYLADSIVFEQAGYKGYRLIILVYRAWILLTILIAKMVGYLPSYLALTFYTLTLLEKFVIATVSIPFGAQWCGAFWVGPTPLLGAVKRCGLPWNRWSFRRRKTPSSQ